MRILHVYSTLSPQAGGPAKVIPELVKAQAARGHKVVVATTNVRKSTGIGTYRSAGWDSLADGQVRVFYGAAQVPPLMASLGLGRYLRRAIPEFDIVNVFGVYRFPQSAAAFWCRRYGVPYIVRPHGSLDPFLFGKSNTNLMLKRLYERWFALPALDAASAIHFTSEEERDRASFLRLQVPTFVVPNGLEWEPYVNLPAKGPFRAKWGIGQEEPVVLFLGRLHFKKGLDLLVPAFERVRRAIPNAQLVIAGPENDSYGAKVRSWVAERGLDSAVRFTGHLDGDDVRRAYVDADVFALPSYTENFGMTVIEAMACALPVVISDQVNIHRDVEDAGAGLVTRCDVDELAHALTALLGDSRLRRRMGSAGRRHVEHFYGWPAAVEALDRQYKTVIDRGGR
jgi:glycosyltransferase involved in cell wall biosynthesis